MSVSVVFKAVTVTAGDVLAAVSHFDSRYADTNDYDSWLEKNTYKYALQHNGKLYPCKHILSQVTGIDTSEFSGGKRTNDVFRRLGFRVTRKP